MISLSASLGLAASVGESILRCAGAIEQTFGGITANLWDDPFEWTLPEHLSTPDRINEHLAEVEATRRCAFSSFGDDASLLKHVVVPSGESRPLIDLLRETLRRALITRLTPWSCSRLLSDNSRLGLSSKAEILAVLPGLGSLSGTAQE